MNKHEAVNGMAAAIPAIVIPARHPGLSKADVYAFVEAWTMQRRRVSLDDYLGWEVAGTSASAATRRPDVEYAQESAATKAS